jgi:type IV pilus assembly protein PilO
MTFDELKQLDPKEPGRWPLPVRVGAIAIFFVIASAALLWFGVWNSSKDELARYESEETKLRTEFKDKHAKAVNLDLYKQQLADIERSFGAMLRQLPGKTEMDDLLDNISQTAAAAGLTTEKFTPKDEESKEFYALKPIEIRLRGNYHQMGDFVSGIAALPRIVTLHDINIKAGKAGIDQLTLEFTARTYRYMDDQEIAMADAARKKATARGSSSQ